MHKDVCILSVRVVQPRHVANIAPAVYKHMYTCILPAVVIERTNNDGWVAIWGQRAPIFAPAPPGLPRSHFFVFYDASIGTVGGLFWADL